LLAEPEGMPVDPAVRPSTRSALATQRVDGVRSTTAAGSGHPTFSTSAVDPTAVLLASHLRYGVGAPHDRLIFSKGHAALLLDRFLNEQR
jgi:transketolase